MTSTPNNKGDIREQLAAIEHERWADWQRWVHTLYESNGQFDKYIERWDKQIATPYANLSKEEQASDMEQVDRYWPLIEAYIETQRQADYAALMAGMPEKKAVRPTPTDLHSLVQGQPYPIDQYNAGFNEAIDQVQQLLDKVYKGE